MTTFYLQCRYFPQVSLFGKGTYLSSELAVSIIYSPGGQGWPKSQIGSTLGCVAVCEMIDDTSVKCTIKEGNANFFLGMGPLICCKCQLKQACCR